jgi:SAM-dependent methyltransferase
MASPPNSQIAAHYGRPGLIDAIAAALAAAGTPREGLRPDDLAAIDQFHTRGREATLDLARLAGLTGGEEVLDLGGGLGGPARTLAAMLGCQVTVLDLTPEFCEAGEELTRWVGLSDRVTFRQGDALEPPFPAGRFDVVWTQHSSMNIPDKPRLFSAAHRMLRPGGRLAIHEIAAGPGEPVEFPVPWASRPEVSFLLPEAELRAAIGGAGFHERLWLDLTELSLAWVDGRITAASAAPLGLHLLLGENTRAAFGNVRRGLAEQRLRVVEAVFDRSE